MKKISYFFTYLRKWKSKTTSAPGMFIGWLLCMGILLSLSCSRPTDEDRILARNGKNTVSVAAFARSYLEQMRYFSIKAKDGPQPRSEHVQSMLLRYHLAERAHEAKLDTLSGFRMAFKAESLAVIIHGLYEKEIAAELGEIAERDVRLAFKRMGSKLHVRHLVAKTKPEIDRLYRQLQQGYSFEQLARTCFRDSVLAHNGGDLGFIQWGDMDWDFENVAYSLKIGEISAPFESRFGWHIVKLENIIYNPIAREDEYQAYREIIRSKIRHRLLAHRADLRIKELMNSKNVWMNVPLIRQLEMERRRSSQSLLPAYSDLEFLDRNLTNLLQKYWQETIATYDGGAWKVKDFVHYLRTLPRGTLDEGMYAAVAKSLRNYFLLQIAAKKHIDREKTVRNILREKRAHLLSNLYVHTVADTIQFSDADYLAYYQAQQPRFLRDRKMQVLEILVPSQEQAVDLIEKIIASGKDESVFRQLAKKFTHRPGAKEKEGFLGTISKNDYDPIGKSCIKLGKGDLYGPLKNKDGYSVVMLLNYENQYLPFEEAKPEIIKTAEQQKVKWAYDKLRNEFLQTAAIQIDEKILFEEIYMSGLNQK